MKKIQIISYCAILVFVLLYVSKPLHYHFGDGIQDIHDFYDLPDNSVDVLVLGSSNSFENINTLSLWEDNGYQSFILGGSVQPLWNTYYFLKEALKTQTPKVIVMDILCTTQSHDYIDDSRIVKNTFGMKWSLDKVSAICVSSPPSRWPAFLIPIFQEHSYYASLSPADFPKITGVKHTSNMWFGYGCNLAVEEFAVPEVKHTDKTIPLHKKVEKYIKKMIELAQEHSIPILLIKTPYVAYSEWDDGKYNSVEVIAKEYGVPFINYNFQYDRIGLNFSKDIADGYHLNYSGSTKFTKILGEDINIMYAVPDRRNSRYSYIWEQETIRFKQFLTSNGITYK